MQARPNRRRLSSRWWRYAVVIALLTLASLYFELRANARVACRREKLTANFTAMAEADVFDIELQNNGQKTNSDSEDEVLEIEEVCEFLALRSNIGDRPRTVSDQQFLLPLFLLPVIRIFFSYFRLLG